MENTPEAAPQNVGTEAPVINSNNVQSDTVSTSEPVSKQISAEQVAQFFGTSADNINDLSKFMEANGKFDKAFKTFKERISNPAPEAPKEQPAQPAQPQMTMEEQMQKLQIPAGYMSQQEYNVRRFYRDLASQPEYAPIADKINSGEMFNEMAKFGIRPMDANGNINDVQVREFFDLYAKTVPAAPAKTPAEAAAPTVEYIPVNNGKIENFQQAAQIIAQSAKLKASGQAEHPQLQAAEEFIKNSLTPGKK